jgi:hypothetical protein
MVNQADHAVIHQSQAPVLFDKQVARMRVGMENCTFEYLLYPDIRRSFG